MTTTLRDSLLALSEEVRLVDLHERVLRGSRAVKMRNRVVVSVAAFLALSGGAVAVAATRPSPAPVPPASPSPVTPSPTPAPSESPSVVLPNVDIRNATFAVPEFPGDKRCPAATRTFKNGEVIVGPGDIGNIKLVIADVQARGDVDGEPGEEILTRILCTDYSHRGQVLALKVAPDGKLTPLGFVLMSPDHKGFEMVTGSLRVQDGTVLVDLTGPDRPDGPLAVLDLQTRGYALRNGKFEQVSGPTKFAQPPEDYRKVDFRNVVAVIRVPGEPPEFSSGVLRISDGKGNVIVNRVSYEVSVLSSAFFTDQPKGVVLYQLKPASGPTRTFVNIYDMPYAVVGDSINMIKDSINLAGATEVEVSGVELRVRINGQLKTYREASDGSWVSSA